MSTGVNGFSSHRLQQARALREVESQRALATLTGLSPEMISRYERGSAFPTADSLLMLSKALRMPPDFFLSDPIQSGKQSPVFFRSMVSTLDTQRDRSGAYLELLEEFTVAVDSIVELPDCTIPSWNELGKLDVLSPK